MCRIWDICIFNFCLFLSNPNVFLKLRSPNPFAGVLVYLVSLQPQRITLYRNVQLYRWVTIYKQFVLNIHTTVERLVPEKPHFPACIDNMWRAIKRANSQTDARKIVSGFCTAIKDGCLIYNVSTSSDYDSALSAEFSQLLNLSASWWSGKNGEVYLNKSGDSSGWINTQPWAYTPYALSSVWSKKQLLLLKCVRLVSVSR